MLVIIFTIGISFSIVWCYIVAAFRQFCDMITGGSASFHEFPYFCACLDAGIRAEHNGLS